MCDLDMAILLGPRDPEAPDAAREARGIFERLAARPFLERLAAAMEPGSPASPAIQRQAGQPIRNHAATPAAS